jgi:hypothetical protein
MEKYILKKSVLKKMLTFNPSDLKILNSNKSLLEEVRQNTKIQVEKVKNKYH